MNNSSDIPQGQQRAKLITHPHHTNWCAGAYPDWLEVNLLRDCNARCEWCIEKNGFHPQYNASWHVIARKAISTGAKNIILLGGEPTLYAKLPEIIERLQDAGRHVWITTNGSKLTREFVETKMQGIYGVNISIHHYCMTENKTITGLDINVNKLIAAIKCLLDNNVIIRLNCNCIAGKIDSPKEVERYLKFAKLLGVNNVRFAEVKQHDDVFVNIPAMMDFKHGLTDDPFVNGCAKTTVIDGVNVTFRILCGLQTNIRPKPINPVQVQKRVLYYDGKIYNGWQTVTKETTMNDAELLKLMENVARGNIPPAEAVIKIVRSHESEKARVATAGKPIKRWEDRPIAAIGCQY